MTTFVLITLAIYLYGIGRLGPTLFDDWRDRHRKDSYGVSSGEDGWFALFLVGVAMLWPVLAPGIMVDRAKAEAKARDGKSPEGPTS